jgi:hypothetical protein
LSLPVYPVVLNRIADWMGGNVENQNPTGRMGKQAEINIEM